jgi:hypothetical protein
MCASCWNERRVTKAVEGNAESESCCWCGSDTTSGIWVRNDPEKLSCHHCEFERDDKYERCDDLAPVKIQEVWVCTRHIQWAMDLAFKPVKDAMKI